MANDEGVLRLCICIYVFYTVIVNGEDFNSQQVTEEQL